MSQAYPNLRRSTRGSIANYSIYGDDSDEEDSLFAADDDDDDGTYSFPGSTTRLLSNRYQQQQQQRHLLEAHGTRINSDYHHRHHHHTHSTNTFQLTSTLLLCRQEEYGQVISLDSGQQGGESAAMGQTALPSGQLQGGEVGEESARR